MGWFSFKCTSTGKQRGIREHVANPAGALSRGYDMAGFTRLLTDMQSDFGYVPAEIASQLPTMRQRCRHAANNDPHVARIIALYQANWIGSNGITLHSRPLNADGQTIDEPAADIIERAWSDWGSRPEWCDVSGTKSWLDHLMLAAECLVRDGEHFLHMRPGFGYPANPYGFAVKALRAETLDTRMNLERNSVQNMVVNGVEVDANDRPLAYHFFKTAPITSMMGSEIPWSTEHVRIPASEIVHIYRQKIEGQTRGIPWLHSVLIRLHMLNEYALAELTAARESANRTASYEGQVGAHSEYDPSTARDALLKSMQASEPGMAEVLPAGWTRKEQVPTRPNPAFDPFRKAMLRDICVGANVAYNTESGDLEGVTYGSLRDGKLTERDMFRVGQKIIVQQMCRRVFLEWLRAYLVFGKSGLPLSKLDKFSAHAWKPRAWPWLDPATEAQVNEISVKHGWKTDEQITDEIGGDWRNNARDIAGLAKSASGTYLEANYAATPTAQQVKA